MHSWGPTDLQKHPLPNPVTPDMGHRVLDIPLTLSQHAEHSCRVSLRSAQGPRLQTLRFNLNGPPATWARSGTGFDLTRPH